MVEDKQDCQLRLNEAVAKLKVLQDKIDKLEKMKRAVVKQYEAALKKVREHE